MSARLLAIEARRSAAIWLVPALLLVCWCLLGASRWIAFLWESTNSRLQVAVPFAAPAMAGTAAWVAGRERRRGMEELLGSTPMSALTRRVALLVAATAWGIAAYAVIAATMLVRTALSATWGGPELWRLAVAVVVMVACAAWGFVVGRLAPNRVTAPGVAIAALGALLLMASRMEGGDNGPTRPSWVSYLAFDRSTADLAPWQILIGAGLTGAALAALSLGHGRTIARSAALIACAGLATLGTVMVWREAPRDDPEIRRVGLGNAVATLPSDQPPPVCTGSPVGVCAHPKWQPLLDDAVVAVNRLAEPLLGLPGVPPRAEPDDVLFMEGGAFSLLHVGESAVYDVSGFADKLVADPASMRKGVVMNEAQFAIRSWLLARADLASHWRCDAPMFTYPYVPGASPESTCAAAERFARLSEGEQRAWLEARYADLRAGRLTLADLP